MCLFFRHTRLVLTLALVGLSLVQSRLPIPPPMPVRPIFEDQSLWEGEVLELSDGDLSMTLYIPSAWSPSDDQGLWIHFHTTTWHMIQEHVRRGVARPLLVFNNGQGSSRYRAPFLDTERLGRWISLVSDELGVEVKWLEMTSFSAGYGGIREIVQVPEYLSLIRRVVLFDSMYAGFETEGEREPTRAQIDSWVPLARHAIEGDKTFVFTFSRILPEDFAASFECAWALADRVGGQMTAVQPGTLAATLDSDHPLIERFDRGNFHLWGYDGIDAPAHLTHVRHIAPLLNALDLVGRP